MVVVLFTEFWNAIFILQLYEWFAILYIIETQRDRGIGEIYYDHNNENMKNSSISPNQNNYRRREMNIQKRLNVAIVLILLTHSIVDFSFKWNKKLMFVLVIFYLIMGLILVFLFFKIIYTMKHLHWYEYERTKKANKWFMFGSVISLSMFVFFFIHFSSID